jgi:predicted AlkP superfamily phosphohydrolase/phosphomutase
MVLSIDGVPFGLAQKLMARGDMPHLAKLAEQASLQQMRSVHPTVSCVAWASYMTGKNPGKHGIYGFIDRRPDSYNLSFPNASAMTAENIWEILSQAGKKVFGMNVPTSYPPRPVNGILIGGFLAPSLEKIAYPAGVADYLRSIDYQIDSDAALARKDKRAMLGNLDKTLDTRTEALFHFLDADNWDFFHTHIMGSDRINHFLWEKMEDEDKEFAPAFNAYYRRIDDVIGKLLERLPDDTPLLIFSDHGFCRIKQEVQLSRYLIETGWTTTAEKIQHPLSINPAQSKAYCMIPGRIYINLKGREPEGIVPLEEYQQTRLALAKQLMELQDPQTGEKIIKKVFMREEIYWPDGTHGPQPLAPEEVARTLGTFGRAADLIAIPYDGYDLKLGLAGNTVFQKTALEGMHTYHDAFMVARGIDLPSKNLEILQLAGYILEKMGIDIPANLDGKNTAVTPQFDM